MFLKNLKEQSEHVPWHIVITFTKFSASRSRRIPFHSLHLQSVQSSFSNKSQILLPECTSQRIFSLNTLLVIGFYIIFLPEFRMNLIQEFFLFCRQHGNLKTHHVLETGLKLLWNHPVLCSSPLYYKRLHFKHLMQTREQ